MKRILTAAILMVVTSVFAQSTTYIKAPELKKYEGKWIGVHNTDTLTLLLQFKEKYPYAPSIYMDAIWGWFSFSENGVVTRNTIKPPLTIYNSSISMTRDTAGTILLTFHDPDAENGLSKATFTFAPGSDSEAKWTFTQQIPMEHQGLTFSDKKGSVVESDIEHKKYATSKILKTITWEMHRTN